MNYWEKRRKYLERKHKEDPVRYIESRRFYWSELAIIQEIYIALDIFFNIGEKRRLKEEQHNRKDITEDGYINNELYK